MIRHVPAVSSISCAIIRTTELLLKYCQAKNLILVLTTRMLLFLVLLVQKYRPWQIVDTSNNLKIYGVAKSRGAKPSKHLRGLRGAGIPLRSSCPSIAYFMGSSRELAKPSESKSRVGKRGAKIGPQILPTNSLKVLRRKMSEKLEARMGASPTTHCRICSDCTLTARNLDSESMVLGLFFILFRIHPKHKAH